MANDTQKIIGADEMCEAGKRELEFKVQGDGEGIDEMLAALGIHAGALFTNAGRLGVGGEFVHGFVQGVIAARLAEASHAEA